MFVPRLASLFSLALAVLSLLPATPSSAAEPKRQTIVDYLQRLPEQTFEGSAPQMWKFIQDSKGAVVDIANGYIQCAGDGAQGDFTVALFRYKDDRPLMAVCQGEPAETDFWYLHFYGLDDKGNFVKLDRAILPPGNEPRRKFELPRKGRTIVVSDTKSGKVQGKYTWNGERFLKE